MGIRPNKVSLSEAISESFVNEQCPKKNPFTCMTGLLGLTVWSRFPELSYLNSKLSCNIKNTYYNSTRIYIYIIFSTVNRTGVINTTSPPPPDPHNVALPHPGVQC